MAKGRQFREKLEYQVKYSVSKRQFKTHEQAEAAVSEARDNFLNTGHSIRGVKITARWRNPDNKNPRHANWKSTDDAGQSLYDFWKTLHKKRGALRGLERR